ncbi:MAG: class I SAM-dependent methyltransferase [Acidobacteriota bacterium]|nr:class I SAM-dependent methyltransferase [Acidobacteriota bacterium]
MARNWKLLREDPALFMQKVSTWLRPMRKDYRRRWNLSLRRWLIRYQTDLVFNKVTWMGVPAWKNVLDSWVYQEIIHEVRPEIVIEIGNANGGSTLYLANILDLVGAGEVIAVDIDHSKFKVKHPRISLVTGDSSTPETLEAVEAIARGRQGIVIHDGDHSREHVLADLRAYSRYVAQGGYFIVEDTVIDLFRSGDGLGNINGPLSAVEEFVHEDRRFSIDLERESFLLTFNPQGYLKRVS